MVTIRPFDVADRGCILAGRDEETQRWLGAESPDPSPTAVIVVDGRVVGWVDADATAEWLGHDEVNVGYAVFPEHRRHGHAARALRLFVERIAGSTPILVIDRDNVASHAVARRAGARLLTDRVIDRFPTSLVYAFIPGHLENSA